MFIWWGSNEITKEICRMETKNCKTCGSDRQYKLFLKYKYWHIFYLFRWVSWKKYFVLCDICRRGLEIEEKKAQQKLKENPIPFTTRYGWTFLVGIIIFCIALGSAAAKYREQRDYRFISAPLVNDMYVTDLAQILNGQQPSPMYGIMRVSAVSGEAVEFVVSRGGYDNEFGPKRDISDGKARNGDYYGSESISLQTADLKTMRDRGIIAEVIRN